MLFRFNEKKAYKPKYRLCGMEIFCKVFIYCIGAMVLIYSFAQEKGVILLIYN